LYYRSNTVIQKNKIKNACQKKYLSIYSIATTLKKERAMQNQITLTETEIYMLTHLRENSMTNLYFLIKQHIDEEQKMVFIPTIISKKYGINLISVYAYIKQAAKRKIITLYKINKTISYVIKLNIPKTIEDANIILTSKEEIIPSEEEILKTYKAYTPKIYAAHGGKNFKGWHTLCSYISNYKSNYISKYNSKKAKTVPNDEKEKKNSKENHVEYSALESPALESPNPQHTDSPLASPPKKNNKIPLAENPDEILSELQPYFTSMYRRYSFPQLAKDALGVEKQEVYLAYLAVTGKAWDKWVLDKIIGLSEKHFRVARLAIAYMSKYDELYYHFKNDPEKSEWVEIRSKEAVFKTILKNNSGIWCSVAFSSSRKLKNRKQKNEKNILAA